MSSFEETPALSLDDLLLDQQFTDELDSRRQVDLSTKVGRTHLLVPFLSANMSDVTGPVLAAKLARLGGMGVLHRKNSPQEAMLEYNHALDLCEGEGQDRVAICVGIKDEEDGFKQRLTHIRSIARDRLKSDELLTVVIDVAHGAQQRVVDTAKWVRDFWGDKINLVVGNFATASALLEFNRRLGGYRVDSFKVGIGPGAACVTRDETGVGTPQFSAIRECAPQVDNIIADGGIRLGRHVSLSLAAGADAVMIGYLFAHTHEANAEEEDGFKIYSGSAFGDDPSNETYSEGVVVKVRVTGSLESKVNRLCRGLESAFSYSNSKNLAQFHARVKYRRVSTLSLAETQPVKNEE